MRPRRSRYRSRSSSPRRCPPCRSRSRSPKRSRSRSRSPNRKSFYCLSERKKVMVKPGNICLKKIMVKGNPRYMLKAVCRCGTTLNRFVSAVDAKKYKSCRK